MSGFFKFDDKDKETSEDKDEHKDKDDKRDKDDGDYDKMTSASMITDSIR